MTSSDELDQLLADWAAKHRLTPRQIAAMRAQVLDQTQSESSLDAEWLWSLLRPLTALLDNVGDLPHGRQPEAAYAIPYLKLA